MNESMEFLKKHRRKSALFDANLLLVYLVGQCGQHQLNRSGRTQQYAHFYPLLERVVEKHFSVLYTTPNVLTEVSNLGRDLGVPFFTALRRVARLLNEEYCTSKDAVECEKFTSLGLTDSGLLSVGEKVLIVTVDLPLYQILRSRNIEAINFTHIFKESL